MFLFLFASAVQGDACGSVVASVPAGTRYVSKTQCTCVDSSSQVSAALCPTSRDFAPGFGADGSLTPMWKQVGIDHPLVIMQTDTQEFCGVDLYKNNSMVVVGCYNNSISTGTICCKKGRTAIPPATTPTSSKATTTSAVIVRITTTTRSTAPPPSSAMAMTQQLTTSKTTSTMLDESESTTTTAFTTSSMFETNTRVDVSKFTTAAPRDATTFDDPILTTRPRTMNSIITTNNDDEAITTTTTTKEKMMMIGMRASGDGDAQKTLIFALIGGGAGLLCIIIIVIVFVVVRSRSRRNNLHSESSSSNVEVISPGTELIGVDETGSFYFYYRFIDHKIYFFKLNINEKMLPKLIGEVSMLNRQHQLVLLRTNMHLHRHNCNCRPNTPKLHWRQVSHRASTHRRRHRARCCETNRRASRATNTPPRQRLCDSTIRSRQSIHMDHVLVSVLHLFCVCELSYNCFILAPSVLRDDS